MWIVPMRLHDLPADRKTHASSGIFLSLHAEERHEHVLAMLLRDPDAVVFDVNCGHAAILFFSPDANYGRVLGAEAQ
jgi:hypothetical protein